MNLERPMQKGTRLTLSDFIPAGEWKKTIK
jgi:hypothetical protein